MPSERFVLKPLWWSTGGNTLRSFERETTLDPEDSRLLEHWAVLATVGEVSEASGCGERMVADAASRLVARGVLVKETDLRYEMPALELEITAACQADCFFCPREAIRKSRGFAHMRRQTFERILDNTSGRGVPAYCLCGIGEPLLHPNWLEFARAIRGRNPESTIYCYTNGWDLGGETGRMLAESPIDVLIVSVHSHDPGVRRRIMRLPGHHDVLAEIDRLLTVLKAAGSTLAVQVAQVELPDLPRDERLAEWCIERGLPFDAWANWNRAGSVTIVPRSGGWVNASPESCYHYASTIFVDHRGRALSCCCDARSETAEHNLEVTPLELIVAARLGRLASGEPLTHLCPGCDSGLSNKAFLKTSFYSLALKK